MAAGLIPSFDWTAWTPPPVFDWRVRTGGIADAEMRRTFNRGIGFILITAPARAGEVLAALLDAGETAFVCGDLPGAG